MNNSLEPLHMESGQKLPGAYRGSDGCVYFSHDLLSLFLTCRFFSDDEADYAIIKCVFGYLYGVITFHTTPEDFLKELQKVLDCCKDLKLQVTQLPSSWPCIKLIPRPKLI